eukprot:TRINITY_DN262_c0_g2_i7.p1 TRINITY_DN262_c0_g2~~TRINITY_DN262_c0_g2_i7.p1  ORF type:complete len:383 (-),score=33.51 TRINITY_DN262_c0_g2_i7:79-1227(-)
MCFTSSSFMGRGLMRDGDTKYFFRLPLYSNEEFEGCLSHYHELGVIPSNGNNNPLFVRKQTNGVPREVREFSSFWNRCNRIESAANLYRDDALDRFLERVRRIMKRKTDIEDDLMWIGISILGDDRQRPPQSWIDAGFVFRDPFKDSWMILCPALQSALNLSNSATKGKGLELAFLLSFRRSAAFMIPDIKTDGTERGRVHRIEANRFEQLKKSDLTTTKNNPVDWAITFQPGILYKLPPKFPLADFILVRDDGDNSPSSKKLQLFSFSFEVYDRRHQFSTIVEEGSSSPEFYGNIPQKLYKAAFGKLPPAHSLPNTTFFFCTTRIGPQPKNRTSGQIPDSDCDSVCLVDGNLLPSIMDNLFKDLVIKTVDYSNNLTKYISE